MKTETSNPGTRQSNRPRVSRRKQSYKTRRSTVKERNYENDIFAAWRTWQR